MNSPALSIALLLLIKLGAVLLLIAALELGLRRAAPRWRVLLLRGALVVTPLVILMGLVPALVQVPKPWGEEVAMPTVTVPRASTPIVGDEMVEFPARTAAPAPAPLWSRPGFWLALAWGVGTLGLFARELCQLQLLRRRVSSARPAGNGLREVWESAAASSGLGSVEILVSGDRQSPFLWPGRRGKLVVPACLAGESREVLEHVFHHEAAHLKHRDPAWILGYRVFVALLWWLPLVPWLAARHLRACEEACDAEAARRGGVGDYREALAELALRLLPMKSVSTAAFLRPPSVRKRLEAVMGNAGKRMPRGWAVALAMVLLLIVSSAIGNAVWAQKEAEEAEAEPSAKVLAQSWRVSLPQDKFPSTEEVEEWLESEGVAFGNWATVRYFPESGQLNIRNTLAELKKALSAVENAGFLAEPSTVDLDQDQILAIENKLKSITLPSFDFQNTPLRDALAFLQKMSIELDAKEPDPAKKGIKIILAPGVSPSEEGSDEDVGNTPITLSARNIPLVEAIRYATSMVQMKYKVEPHALVVVPLDYQETEMITNTYPVPSTFLDTATVGREGPSPQETAKQVLENVGITFGPGTGVVYNPEISQITVKQTPDQMELVEAFVRYLENPEPASAQNEAPADFSLELAIENKLKTIRLPSVEFVNTPLREAIQYLQQRSVELDTEGDIAKRGINIILDLSASSPKEGSAEDIGNTPITLSLNNVPLAEALRYTTSLAQTKYKVESHAVLIIPISRPDRNVMQGAYTVPPSFLFTAGNGDDADGSSSPVKWRSAKEVLESAGITFGEGTSAIYNPGTSQLIVRNTPDQVELVEAYIQAIRNSPPKGPKWLERWDSSDFDIGEPEPIPDTKLYSVIHRVPSDFLAGASGEAPEKTIKELLENAGITFGDGAGANFNPEASQIIVRQTKDQLELIEAWLKSFAEAAGRGE